MIYPRSLRDAVVMLVNAIARPIDRALAHIDLDDLTEDDE